MNYLTLKPIVNIFNDNEKLVLNRLPDEFKNKDTVINHLVLEKFGFNVKFLIDKGYLKPIKIDKIDISDLITVSNYAKIKGQTPAWIYRLGKQGELNIVEVDGVKFVNTKK